jgi:hypothetical protein
MQTLALIGEEILFIADEPMSRAPASRRWRVFRWLVAAGIAAVVVIVLGLGAVKAVRQSWCDQCAGRLRRLGQAMHAYHEAHGHFPAPALARSDGSPLLSWRVALLPHLGYRSLYERFHLDEPWDSPHNRALVAEMPPEFACPGGEGQSAGRTGYRVIVGPDTDLGSVNTPFERGRGVDLREITDGASNTILVIETAEQIPWTKADDLQWSPGGPLPALASPHPGGSHVVTAAGSTKFLKSTINPASLLSGLTINGGEGFG